MENEWVILQHAVENTSEAFVTIDQDHKVLIFNKAAERIFGYRREEVIGRDMETIMTPECSRGHHAAVADYLANRAPEPISHESELIAYRKNGQPFPAAISFSVTRIDGRFFFTGLVRDITETKALQERIIRSERLAALGQIVAEIAHEIKNPLVMIGGFARQLAASLEKEKDRRKVQIIAAEVMRLERLLAELRELYRPRPLEREAIDVQALIEEIRALVQEDCRHKNIEINMAEQNRMPLWISGDSHRLKQVLLNLAKNSIEAMESGGKLYLLAGIKDDRVEIRVQDEGHGISAADLANIFSPFFSTKQHGTGLGLSISKRIIEEHEDGVINVDSEVGKGTIFTISLPRREAPE